MIYDFVKSYSDIRHKNVPEYFLFEKIYKRRQYVTIV